MDAMVLAGGSPKPDDPLFPLLQGRPRALLEIAGRPMVQWVLDALSSSHRVERVLVLGLDASSGLSCRLPTTYMPDQGDVLVNIRAGLDALRASGTKASHALVVSSDVPAITGDMLDWRADRIMEAKADMDYAVIERSTMETRYPDSGRSFVRLQTGQVCGSDIHGLRLDMGGNMALWNKIISARKSPLRMAALLGPSMLIRLLFRRLTLARAAELGGRRLGISVGVHLCPYPEMGMDVDKPDQMEMLEQDLLSRRGSSA